MLRLKQLKNSKSERPVNNQYQIISNRFIFFVSYETFICAIDTETHNLLIFDYLKNADVSRTTAKYLYQFLEENFFRLKNFREDLHKDVEKEKVYFRKISKASNYQTDYNVMYVPDDNVEKLFNL
uniref:DUF8033 domain-containing protein n=1 Tax=Myoviridae sp. ctZgq1 TaxID=2826666 RepID=A0A8S5LXA3_9CAUD|nr:MAG TPA: hypothetical protein [Myoviridae sp. ctZgq1]